MPGPAAQHPQDQDFLDSFRLPVAGKQKRVLALLRALPEGLSEWAMHPARHHAADRGSDVRSSDYDVLMAASTRSTLADEGIVVLGYGDPEMAARSGPRPDVAER